MDGDRPGARRPRRRLRRPLGARPETLPFLHLVPNVVTIVGLCSGLTALRLGFAGRFEPAVALVIFAAVIDGLDGLLARRLNAASRFGSELDSLSDFVCFGVVPAMLVYEMALAGAADLAWTAALVFAVCACLRLARFNVSRDAPVTGKAHFVGVPAPAGALLGLLPAYVTFAGIADARALPWLVAPWLVAPWLVAVGALMICRLRTFAPKGLRIQRQSARWLLVGAALVVGVGISSFWLLMILLSGAYLATLAFALVAVRRRPPRPPTVPPHRETDMEADAVTRSYRRWAPVYDRTFGAFTNAGRRRLAEHVNRRTGTVLEVGVGTGLSLARYAPHLAVTGVDFSGEMLARARARVADDRLDHVVALRQMDARALDFPDASFDTVVAMHVISVVPEPERVMAEMARVCRPGGEVLILNHFLHEHGALGFLGRRLAPLVDTLGWHSDFPEATALACDALVLDARVPSPPFGMFTRLHLRKPGEPRDVTCPAADGAASAPR